MMTLVCLLLLSVVLANPTVDEYAAALKDIDWNAVKADIAVLLKNSRDFWPADYGNYGPFFVRQAWHCSGSYRTFDGHGGCDGGRQRFDPERSWADNTNLDKAKTLLIPIKQKYGLGLSWGDLMILTGNTAIETMGGPVLGFCAGRIDDYDGKASELLGPTRQQNESYPCPIEGKCKSPLGTTTVGLIYLNPEGPMGVPDPVGSSKDVRDAFGRMDMNDMETVALIGGGHAFGKAHGACPAGPGPDPDQDPGNPWPGACGSGKGKDTFTSGFEGPWSMFPTRWGNFYFTELVNNQWEVHVGPGGHHQWRTKNGPQGIMMLTSDVSLLSDSNYRSIVQGFAANLSLLEYHFSRAWYKLTTRDMGPVTRCVGPWVPPAQPFQYPLPAPPKTFPAWNVVQKAVENIMNTANSSVLVPDFYQGRPYYGALFIHLAYQSASTFRNTDWLGGANGARIRFPPQSNFPYNVAMDKVLTLLNPVYNAFTHLSWADLIVFAGTVALNDASQFYPMEFCPGRTDAMDGAGSMNLQPNGNYSFNIKQQKIERHQIGLSDKEMVALAARPRSPSQMARLGYFGSWTNNPTLLSNDYFNVLLNETWDNYVVPGTGMKQFKARGKEIYMLQSDLNLKWDTTSLAHVVDFSADNDLFLNVFSKAWTKLMNADRFDGPTGNVCDQK